MTREDAAMAWILAEAKAAEPLTFKDLAAFADDQVLKELATQRAMVVVLGEALIAAVRRL